MDDKKTALSFTRRQLYDDIWEVSVAGLARRYDIPYALLMKQVKAAGIPIPPSGYWTQLAYGKAVSKASFAGDPDQVILIARGVPGSPPKKGPPGKGPEPPPAAPAPAAPAEAVEERPETAPAPGRDEAPAALPRIGQAALEAEDALIFLEEGSRAAVLAAAGQIKLPGENARMHPKIVAHRKKVLEWQREKKARERRSWGRRTMPEAPLLAGTVSESSIPRACRLMDALIRAMEPLGCSLTDDLKFVVNGEEVPIVFTEAKDTVPHVPTKEENLQLLRYEEERRGHSYASKPSIRKYDYLYSGRMSAAISNVKSFRDCKSYRLEERLGEMLLACYEAASAIRKAREAREEAARKKQEEEARKKERMEQYNQEVRRTNGLVRAAEDYDTACKIRAYLAAAAGQKDLDEETCTWLKWAREKADWYDPAVAREDEFFGARKHQAEPDAKNPKESRYYWDW